MRRTRSDTTAETYRSLAVRWFKTWEPSLDDALTDLPQSSLCPPELCRLLAEPRGEVPKHTALVLHRDRPVAVVTVRQLDRRTWEPVTSWIVPGVVAPAEDGFLLDALAALRLRLAVAWWRMDGETVHSRLSALQTTPVHRIAPGDREAYWRSTNYWKTVRQARRKCAHLEVLVGAPGSPEWVARSWERQWRTSAVHPALDDRVLVAGYLESRGLHFTLTLTLDGSPVAGATCIADGEDLVAGLLYRDGSLGNLPTGVRMIDETFSQAERIGAQQMDLGGGHDYKRRWAPEAGAHSQFVMEPLWRTRLSATRALARSALPGR